MSAPAIGRQRPSSALDLSLVNMPDHRMLGRTLIANRPSASLGSVDSVVEAFDVAVGKILLPVRGLDDAHDSRAS